MIYFGGTTQTKAGQLFKDMIGSGMRCSMMGPDGCYEQAMVNAVGMGEFKKHPEVKFYATYGGLPIEALAKDGGRGEQFVKEYEALYDAKPTEAYSAYGYECTLAVLEGMRRAGKKDRNAIREAVLGLRNFEGATGTWSFDEKGDTTNQTMSGNVVKVEMVEDEKTGEKKEVAHFRLVERLNLETIGN